VNGHATLTICYRGAYASHALISLSRQIEKGVSLEKKLPDNAMAMMMMTVLIIGERVSRATDLSHFLCKCG
jgi:hypothetical protein